MPPWSMAVPDQLIHRPIVSQEFGYLLTEEQAIAIADRLSHEAIVAMAAYGEITFGRDRR